MFPFILIVCLGGVFCLTPLAVYLSWLAGLNRKPRPSVIMGGWDFVALCWGLSGFVLFGGGLLLSLVQSNVRFWMRGNFEALREAWMQEQARWFLIVAVYLLVVLGGAALALARRRRSLIVYNVDPDQFEVALGEVFEQHGLAVERRGNLWVGGAPLCEVDSFPAGQTVILRWRSDDARLCQDVERQVREAVRSLPGSGQLAARWLMSAVASCAVIVGLCTVLLLYGLALLRNI